MIDYLKDKDSKKSFHTDIDGNAWTELDDDVYMNFRFADKPDSYVCLVWHASKSQFSKFKYKVKSLIFKFRKKDPDQWWTFYFK